MAIKKNKDGILAAINAAAVVSKPEAASNKRAHRSLPSGTIGSLRAGLGGIQEIDTSLILPWGPQDRLASELTAVNSDKISESITDLADSISEAGQQIPVLLRPASEQDGHFEVVYGRRRILACRKLNIPVKSLIRTLDDTEALMAKGLENASRVDLSYYERARFAKAILEQGHDRPTTCQALSISKNTLSQLERITRLIPDVVGDAIGSAPESGRPKWMSFAAMFESGTLDEAKCIKALSDLSSDLTSDELLTQLLNLKLKRSDKSKSNNSDVNLADVGKMTFSGNAIKITLSKDHRDDFKKFLEGEMNDLIDRYKNHLGEK